MKLLVVHGVPGVGKFSVGRELAGRTGFRFLHYHSLGMFFAPLFGFGSPEFVELRDRFYADVLHKAMRADLAGIVSTFLFEPTLSLDWLKAPWGEVGAEVFLVGLTCSESELRRRVEGRRRGQMGGIDDFDFLEEKLRAREFEFPVLPCPSIVIDTTQMSVEAVVSEVMDALPTGWRLFRR